MKRLEAATPLSMAEIQADKDQLRAEFAMSTRRLELSVEQMKSKTTSQLAELGKKTDAINRLKVELGEKTAAIFSLEAREKSLQAISCRPPRTNSPSRSARCARPSASLADKQAELAKLSTDLDERSVHPTASASRSWRCAPRSTRSRAASTNTKSEAREIGDRLDRERKDASDATAELNDERGKVEKLGDRVGQLERALIAQTTEAEILGRRVQELEGRLAEQMKVLAEREFECSQLRDKLAKAEKTEADLRAEYRVAAETRHRDATEGLQGRARAGRGTAFPLAEGPHRAAQEQSPRMKREAEQTWAAERVENALLRERINDIAAEIARLTAALEGQASPIEAMLAGEPVDANGFGEANATATPDNENKGNLADRIRALQTRASRVQQPN